MLSTGRSRLLAAFLAAAATGLLIFGFLSWRVTTVDRLSRDEAAHRLGALRAIHSGPPVLTISEDGTVVRREIPPPAPSPRISRLCVVVYHVASQRLVESRIPFWFFRLKAPAAQYALEGTGLDLERMGVTAVELQQYGSRVVLDHRTTGGGNIVFIWTE